tara:strand:- start:2178 stop:2531 length:354 start_codon:yes stop_codon:yes gene_type:complete
MKLDEYICYIKDDKVNSLGMELNSNIMREKFKVGGGKSILRKNLGVPLSLFLINNQKNIFEDFMDGKPAKKKKEKSTCVPGDLFSKLINLRANPIMKQKKTKKRKLKKKKRKTKKNV